MTIVDVQISPAHCEWAELREHSLAAEQMGFGALWVYDHMAGAQLGGDRMLECFTLLGALAELTSRIELGTMVVNVWNRQPGVVVSAAASVAIVSGRQFHFGLGAGAAPGSKWAFEHDAVGHELMPTVAERQAGVERVLALSDAMWRDDRHSAFASFPLPRPRPHRIVGVSSVRLSEIAGAEADGINVDLANPRHPEMLAAARRAAGDRPFVVTAWTRYDEGLLDPGHPVRRQVADAGIDRLILAELGRPTLAEQAANHRAVVHGG